MLYERYHTRQDRRPRRPGPADAPAGHLHGRPDLASIGLPGLNGFVGEFLVLLGMFQRGWAEAPAALAVQYRVISVAGRAAWCLGAWYMLGLVQRVFFGPLREPARRPCASRRARPGLREVAGPGAAGGVDRLDRPAAGILPRPHGPDARSADRRRCEQATCRSESRRLPTSCSTLTRSMHTEPLALSAEIVLLLRPWRSTWPARCSRRRGCGPGWPAADWCWRPPACGAGRRGRTPAARSLADPLALYGRWLALALGAVLVLLTWRPLAHRRHRRIPRLAAAGRRRPDARGRGRRPGAAVRRPGTDLHPHLHPALPRPPRRRLPGSGGQVLLPQHAGLGHVPLRA